MKVIACYNIKGGVGKTTTAVNLAHLAARQGYRTLLWDMDIQGSAGYLLKKAAAPDKVVNVFKAKKPKKSGIKSYIQRTPYENFDLLPADFSLKKMDKVLLDKKSPQKKLEGLFTYLSKKYDWVIIDCPAGYSRFTEVLKEIADVLLIPVIPSPLTLQSLELFKRQITKEQRENMLFFPFFSMVDRRKKLHREIVGLHNNGKRGFLHSHIPYSSKVEQMAVELAPLLTYDRRSAAARSYKELWEEITTNIGMHERVKKIKMWS